MNIFQESNPVTSRLIRFRNLFRCEKSFCALLVTLAFCLSQTSLLFAQTLEEQLKQEGIQKLAADAEQNGDAKRGAILFYQPFMSCRKCHSVGDSDNPLGPELTKLPALASGEKRTTESLVESVLFPSKVIDKKFESVTALTTGGRLITGLLVNDDAKSLTLRDFSNPEKSTTLQKSELEEIMKNKLSIMPAGQVNQLTGRQQFLDLIRYLSEITTHGRSKALELEPAPALYAARPLPEYEAKIDHAGMISSLSNDNFKRGEAIYNRLCINCHGTHDKPGSLPTSLRFASGKFKNGNDPFTMYQTLTRGFGLMVQQAWMVPEQKYDVIHYIREVYLKSHNPSQYFRVTPEYLKRLPVGDTRGPKPVNVQQWVRMNYGRSLINTYEIGKDAKNFAYKGIAVRLDQGPGGISRGEHWMVFDHDTMRVAAAWSGKGFIDWNGIHFNGRHNIHPRVVGHVHFENKTSPGWGHPETGSFDDPRLKGRDGRLYGPLPREWAHYKGLYHHEGKSIIKYTVGKTEVLEMPKLQLINNRPLYARTFNIGPRDQDMILQVGTLPEGTNNPELTELYEGTPKAVLFGSADAEVTETPEATPERNQKLAFNGATHLSVKPANDFDLTSQDFTILARIKTKKGGSIFTKAAEKGKWIPDGKSFFVRGGRLVYDIGWVGQVASRRRVNDGKWHSVAVSYSAKTEMLTLSIDGKRDATRKMRPEKNVKNHVVHLGYTSTNFPSEKTNFQGEIEQIRFYQRELKAEETLLPGLSEKQTKNDDPSLIGHWSFSKAAGDSVSDASGKKHTAVVHRGIAVEEASQSPFLLAGVTETNADLEWIGTEDGNLRLKIPAGKEPLRFTLWQTDLESTRRIEQFTDAIFISNANADLTAFTKGGKAHWPEKIVTEPLISEAEEPYVVDVLTRPAANPWMAQVRLTGFDFFKDGDRMAVCSWDGDVWLVSGLNSIDKTDFGQKNLTWRRIASGLFQPLGVKIVKGVIHVTCRDQLVILRDYNGDGETDFYENFNNDHQVTDHFHEFAMGLQTDAEGNFYYAKSARHALKALVPHHGTLLKVSKDGSRTEILANGFRAANGVCLNPDGSFIVTDQEGHWNPKNRINWVRKGGFYGNMFGYHDVTDSSDEAMEQPLCWITNAFDRSPAELLWVESDKWGPLSGSLLNLSYGYGQIYVVPHEEVKGQMQGGMCALPLERFPTGLIRGRFHPNDGQLYTCGMFAWAGSQHQPGGFYRVRYTDRSVILPVKLEAVKEGMQITFTETIDSVTATDVENYAVKTWDLKRTAGYGSRHYNEKNLKINCVELSEDKKTILLHLREIQPTWCMEIKYTVRNSEGKRISGTIHNTVHHLGE